MAENKHWSQEGALRWELELAAVSLFLPHSNYTIWAT